MRKVLALALLFLASALPANAGLIRHVLKPIGKGLGHAAVVSLKATTHAVKKVIY